MWYEYRHKIELSLLIFFTIVMILAGVDYWKYWAVLVYSIFFLYISDVMFLSHKMFMYEPNLHYWAEANSEDY